MTYGVTVECIKYKYQDCVEVCLVDYFYEDANMIVIITEECIDCAVCEPECPVDEIKPDTIPDAAKWIAFNQKYAALWPNISEKGKPTADADDWADVHNTSASFGKSSTAIKSNSKI